jgi:D-3-phosphoglycerate dehydrogenase
MFRVLLTDNIDTAALDVFSRYADIDAVRVGTLPTEELADILPDFDAIVVRSPTRLTSQIIEAGGKLKFIGRAGVGVDNIAVDAATARGITVMNVPSGNTVSTAEYTVGLILAVARRIAEADRSVRDGNWERKRLRGVELHGKTLGIIGLGRVGREVARRMLAFSMDVVAADPEVSLSEAADLGVRLEDMDTVLRRSDVITVHVALGPGTRGLISDREVEKMRDGVLVIDCARGGVVDETALKRGLDSGKIAGVGLDVYETEPPGDHPLFENRRSVFTPHLGGATGEAHRRVVTYISESIANALTQGEIRDAVNTNPG